MVTNSPHFPHLRIFQFFFDCWRIFFRSIGCWVDSSFSSALEKYCGTFFCPPRLWWDIQCNSNCFSSIGKVSYISYWFQHFCFFQNFVFLKFYFDVSQGFTQIFYCLFFFFTISYYVFSYLLLFKKLETFYPCCLIIFFSTTIFLFFFWDPSDMNAGSFLWSHWSLMFYFF